MEDLDAFENCKIEIRSILLSYQQGCFLSEFLKSYSSLIGQNLPSKKFGFRSDLDFLYSMPDAVQISVNAVGDPHLRGVADSKTKHIQKLVGRQKYVKMKPPKPNFARSNFYYTPKYTPPPRFIHTPAPKISGNTYNKVPSSIRSTNPPVKSTSPLIMHSPQFKSTSPLTAQSLPVRSKSPQNSQSSPSASLTPCEKLCSVIGNSEKGIQLAKVLDYYKSMLGEELSYENYGFFSLEECIDDVEELDIVNWKNDYFVIYLPKHKHLYPESSKYEASNGAECQNENQTMQSSMIQSSEENLNVTNAMSATGRTESSSLSPEENSYDDHISGNMMTKLRKVAECNPQGIMAADFPAVFEEVTLTTFHLEELGYNNLANFIDDIPEVFTRKAVAGSKKNWIIYPTDSLPQKMPDTGSVEKNPKEGVLLIDYIIINVRMLLEGNPEGIDLRDFLHVYSINTKDTLNVQHLGYESVESFLRMIKDAVPLCFEYSGNSKIVRLAKWGTEANNCFDDFPSDVIPPSTKYVKQTLPSDMNTSQYFPMYTSSISSPKLLYIQLVGDNYSLALGKLADSLEAFYNGPQSQKYMMKDVHIKVGVCCVALWPFDFQWYRAQIICIESMESVQVEYVDYGTKDTVSKRMLRYMREEFVKLPAQAMKAELAHLRPPNNADKWNIQVMRRLLTLCQDIVLMAKVDKVMPDGSYSIVVCNTNGEKDVFITDVLIQEGLADNTSNLEGSFTEDKESENCVLSSVQAIQAQYCLQTLAAIAPTLANNKHYLALLQFVSMRCSSPGPHIDVTKLLQSQNLDQRAGPSYFATSVKNNSTPSPTVTSYLGNQEKEIFNDDDDDQIFREFCNKVSVKTPRYVKRLLFKDDYQVHIIIVDSQPYASSGDIAHLLWENFANSDLIKRLQAKHVDYKSIIITDDDYPEVFDQMQRYKVKGIQTSSHLSIILFPLEEVLRILQIFGHPSINLRLKMMSEIANFNIKDPEWQEYSSSDNVDAKEETPPLSVTDDDKIDRMCLFDLQAMEKGIHCKIQSKRKFLIQSGSSIGCDEIFKLEQLHIRVQAKITQVSNVCKMFERNEVKFDY